MLCFIQMKTIFVNDYFILIENSIGRDKNKHHQTSTITRTNKWVKILITVITLLLFAKIDSAKLTLSRDNGILVENPYYQTVNPN